MSRARELAKAGGVQQRIAGFSSHVGMSTFLAEVHMEDNLTVDGNIGVGGNLTVTGTTTFNGGTLTLGDANTDNIVFGGEVDSNIIPDDDNSFDLGSSSKEWKDLYIDGTAHVDTLDVDENAGIIGNLTLTGNGDFNGDLDVDGTTNLDAVDIDGAVDMASSLTLAGNADFNGNLDVSGDVDLGNATSDTITVTGRFDSNLLPSTDNVRDLGASDKEWRHLFVDGRTEIDNLNSVGIATFNNNAIHANIYSTGISTISGFRFPTSDGDEDQALVTDGNGALSFKTLSGGGGGATGAATTISAGVTTATQGQTVFSTPHPHNDGTSTYSTQVFVNGVKQRPQGASSSKDFTTSSNSTITFEEGLSVGSEVVSVVYFGHTIDEEYFTATQGQVLFPLTGSLSAQKNFRVFVNGVKQRVGTDFGVAAPVTLVQPCAEGAHVEIVCDNAEDAFVATDQQTNFTPTSTDISEDNMQVYVNGIQLFSGLDYSIGSPSVTLTDATGLTVGDEVDVCIRRTT